MLPVTMGRAFEYRRAAKEKRWDRMSKVFPKLARAITVAAKQGGPDPDSNPKLRTAILNAKAENMPKDNVEKALARATGKDAADISEVNYEAKGPHGVLLFIECASDNTNRTVTNLKVVLGKNGGQLVESGSLQFMFDRKAVIQFGINDEMDLEEVELALIDAGLEDFEVSDETAYAYADYTDFGRLSKGVEDLGIEVSKASLQRFPTTPQEFSEQQLEEIEALIDKIEDDEDVQAVFTNAA